MRRLPVLIPVALTLLATLALSAQDSRVTPDQTGWAAQATQEQLDLALAFSPGERIVRLSATADRRLQELKAVVEAKRLDWVAPLANAYVRLVSEGVEPLIQQSEQKGLELTANLVAVERVARKHPGLLDELTLQAPVEMEGLIQKAADTAKKHLATVRASVQRAKKARGDLGGPEEAEVEDDSAAAGAEKGEGFGFDLRDFSKPGGGGGGSSADDRRKGRGD